MPSGFCAVAAYRHVTPYPALVFAVVEKQPAAIATASYSRGCRIAGKFQRRKRSCSFDAEWLAAFNCPCHHAQQSWQAFHAAFALREAAKVQINAFAQFQQAIACFAGNHRQLAKAPALGTMPVCCLDKCAQVMRFNQPVTPALRVMAHDHCVCEVKRQCSPDKTMCCPVEVH